MSAVRNRLPPKLPTDDEVRLATESSRMLAACLGKGPSARIRVVADGRDVTVPVNAIHMLVEILSQMSQGNAITIIPQHAQLTTQQAADLLNVSRPYLVQLLETGKLKFIKVGTHRRVLFKDLIEFENAQREASKRAADELSRLAQESGGYD